MASQTRLASPGMMTAVKFYDWVRPPENEDTRYAALPYFKLPFADLFKLPGTPT